MDGWTDEWMYGWMYGWIWIDMDGWMATDECIRMDRYKLIRLTRSNVSR